MIYDILSSSLNMCITMKEVQLGHLSVLLEKLKINFIINITCPWPNLILYLNALVRAEHPTAKYRFHIHML